MHPHQRILPYLGHQVRFGFGAGIDASQHAACEERFGFPFVEFWAMSGRFITDNIEPRLIHTRAIGGAVPGFEARVVDQNDEDVPPGQPGDLVVRHIAAFPRKGFFSGYLKDGEATKEAWRNGWFHTGDHVTRDETGMFHFLDRKKNIHSSLGREHRSGGDRGMPGCASESEAGRGSRRAR